MTLIRHHPPPPLSRYVECLWWSQRDHAQVFGEHMLPSGSAQMIITLHESPVLCLPAPPSRDSLTWSRAIVHGPQGGYYTSGPKPAGACVGVAFRPGAAQAILGCPMSELADRHVSLEALWGTRAHELRERLLAAQHPPALFRVLEWELSARLDAPLRIHPAVSLALAQGRAVVHALKGAAASAPPRIADIQRQTGVSPRHFIALFRAAVGLTPKHYFRVQRFTTVLRRLANHREEDLADLAASVGYSDQAHMTREFREFAGVTPTQYRPRDAQGILHHRASHEFRSTSALLSR